MLKPIKIDFKLWFLLLNDILTGKLWGERVCAMPEISAYWVL
jgi:hypothetical protein